MTTTLQLKLRGIFLSDDLPETHTNPVGDFFSNIISAVSNFFHNLTDFFNQKFPPETRDEQIHRLFEGATPYLIVAAVLIACLCCWICIFPCISCILVGIFNLVSSFFRCVFEVVRWFFQVILGVVRSFFRCVRWVLCCGRGKMMRAPGRFPLKLPRKAFEANPGGYFRDLRGKPNNFCY